MAGKTLDLFDVIVPDTLGVGIARQYTEWETLRTPRRQAWEEVQRYIYSTDTTTTTNSKLPWKNKTTLPKLCQIRDNIYANYIASLFPKDDFIEWEADKQDDQSQQKTELLESFAEYIVNQPANRNTLYKLVLDYIDYGNAFAGVEWTDNSGIRDGTALSGYVGPVFTRISPYDIVFNPLAPDFSQAPKIIRSLITVGEVKDIVENNTLKVDNIEEMKQVFEYLKNLRVRSMQHVGDFIQRDAMFAIDGFTSYTAYLRSNFAELLTFYGDFYDIQADKFYKNHIITVIDRHKILGIRPNPAITGSSTIHHIGWRPRQDNIWAMGPLENLIGMQYRIDHIENLKADVFDLIAAPPLMVKGLVEDFEWGPFSRIYVGDDGDVKSFAPEGNVLSANLEIDQLKAQMEEYAGSPKEAAGFRTPGEKTAYEVQRLENAASRIFYAKTRQFEEFLIEPLINDALELARRKANSKFIVRVFNDQTNAIKFLNIQQDDLAGVGRLKPKAARNFAEKAERVQNVTQFFGSVLGQDPDIKAHFSTIAIARMFEELLDIDDYEVVKPYVRLFEEQQARAFVNSGQENLATQAMTPGGMSPDDHNLSPADQQAAIAKGLSSGMVPGGDKPGGKGSPGPLGS